LNRAHLTTACDRLRSRKDPPLARTATTYVCQSCGAVHSKWAGRCEACGDWNTISEEAAPAPAGIGSKNALSRGKIIELELLEGASEEEPRIKTSISELDRVLGGGIVPGSALLIGGDPGIGKSTLLLQASAELAKGGQPVTYVSGEEALAQIRLRAKRLGLTAAPVKLATATNLESVLATLEQSGRSDVIIIDSIQTLWTEALDSAPGTVAQVRAVSQALTRHAKKTGTSVILVGHVTKEGQIAGPRVVEHVVDGVFYFEGERGHQFRILRAVKNRFGPTDEIGVFEMSDKGLIEVTNPSSLFLGERSGETAGAAVFAGIEGTRPILVEIQALVAGAGYGTGRRTVVGWDTGRLATVLAVLDARCGVSLGGMDVYLNVAGGIRITEPAADLAVAAAVLSSLSGTPLSGPTVVFGEIALSGAIRPVGQLEARLKESAKLGFEKALVPAAGNKTRISGIEIIPVTDLPELMARLAPEGIRQDTQRASQS